MTLAVRLNELERSFFFDRTIGTASATGYVASNTWRAFRSVPKTPRVPSEALIAAFDFLTPRFENFLLRTAPLSRESFDAFHAEEVEGLYHFLRTVRRGIVVQPAATGEFHELAYNAYAKVINLAHTHWCFRVHSATRQIRYIPSDHPQLRACLHVPLDIKVLTGVRRLIDEKLLPQFALPQGSMGSVRSREQYIDIQNFLRRVADDIESTNFTGSPVSPLAFEGFW